MKKNIIKHKASIYFITASLLLTTACSNDKFKYDASGVFEATEIIVSAQTTGTINELNIIEGDELKENSYIGYIDTIQLYLQKQQLQTLSKAVDSKRPDISLQIASLKNQIQNTQKDKVRIQNMLRDGAATQKQLDNINTQEKVLQDQINAQVSTLSTSTNSIDKEAASYLVQVLQIEDQLQKSYLRSPINGTILNKYAEQYELATPGKPIYKIADTKLLFLRAYVVYDQLAKIKLGQQVEVYITDKDGQQQVEKGTVSWISDKAEFTPKTIQTVDERQNLVYAIKIAVPNNDGLIKIGMYGDVKFGEQ